MSEPDFLQRMFRLDGRRALVTGGARGLGLAAAVGLARAGASVTVVSRTRHELEEACHLIGSTGGLADYSVLDVTDSAAVTAFIGSRLPYDVLVNNAGINRPKLLTETPDVDIDDVLDLNVKATFYMCREVARKLQSSNLGGSIINVTSQMGHVGSPRRTVYCASKHAIEGMSKALAWELGAGGIRVNTVCPTFIETELTAGMFKDRRFLDWVVERIALGRLGRIDEVVGPIVFLASEASSLMTGSALMLDGGWTAA